MKDLSPPAIVQAAEMSEQQLIETAREAVNSGNWTIGQCAAEWTQRYSAGRTDSDFAILIGASANTVQQARQVWERFGDSHARGNLNLSWSHFREVLGFDRPSDALQVAADNGMSLRELQAWIRAQRGEPLVSAKPLPTIPKSAPEPHEADTPTLKPPSVVKPTPRDKAISTIVITNLTPGETQQVVLGKPLAATSQPIAPTNANTIAAAVAALQEISRQLQQAERQKLASELRALADDLDPPEQPTAESVAAHQVVVNEWNLLGKPFPKCASLTPKRRKALSARLRDPWWRENWRQALERVRTAPGCRGEWSIQWIADFEWFLRPDSAVSLIEGKYDRRDHDMTLKEQNDLAFDEVFGDDSNSQ